VNLLDHVGGEDRLSRLGIDDVGRNVGKTGASPGILQERSTGEVTPVEQSKELRAAFVELVVSERPYEIAFLLKLMLIRAVGVRERIEHADRWFVLKQRRIRRRCSNLISGVRDERAVFVTCLRRLQVRGEDGRAARRATGDAFRRKLTVKVVESENL